MTKIVGAEAVMPAQSRKLCGYRFYREVLGSPKFVLAPMVDQSELAWRKLARRYGAQLAYTPMINAKMFAAATNRAHRDQMFNTTHGEEGGTGDRPLIVQFCANDPTQLLTSAQIVEPHCDAVDINLGCPQEIARKGHYGAFLQDDWDLIFRLINVLHENLSIPVTAKFRVFPTIERTVAYARMLESAGAQILTCHGRTRDQRGQNSGLADWEKIRAVKEAVSVPVFANGNVLYHSDIEKCLAATGADAVMSAESQLYNAALFATAPPSSLSFDAGVHVHHTQLALEYLDIVKGLKTKTPISIVKGHLFKLMRPGLAKEKDLRERLGHIQNRGDWLDQYAEIVVELRQRMEDDAQSSQGLLPNELIKFDPRSGIKMLPHWLAQPYFRTASPKGPTRQTMYDSGASSTNPISC